MLVAKDAVISTAYLSMKFQSSTGKIKALAVNRDTHLATSVRQEQAHLDIHVVNASIDIMTHLDESLDAT
jgi:hypothetical protein